MPPYFIRPFVLSPQHKRVTVAERVFLYRACHEHVLSELYASTGKVVQMNLNAQQHQLFGPRGYGIVVEQSQPAQWFSSVVLHSDRALKVAEWLTRDLLVAQGRPLVICVCSDGDIPAFRARLHRVTWPKDAVCVLGLRIDGTLWVTIEERREEERPPWLSVDHRLASAPLSHRDTQYISTMLYQIVMECFVMGFRARETTPMPCRHYSIHLSGFRSERHWP
ncbi:hypothetical protein CKF94_22355 [Vibrio coralliilyticus]|uniref:hypothetical protein n=1 Tax=Vibrio coralliilyticus TaxID=190893 RepID=UPI0006CDE753|nr:hypothetical protein [Vibrio coralliilyticus]AXN34677.1 hypothetical protein DVV14_25635 [Vibrio coralliilyticus]KPH25130.1 hypothetical protein ADU60_16745 [Vibrio coralliilyticus]PAU35944.1 hypothetical protein CKF94_22355 [Vibrio coralliilyticus]